MQLTDRFLDFADQQLGPEIEPQAIRHHLAVYVTAPPVRGRAPLVLIRQWSSSDVALPPAEGDPALRSPDEWRRWYPLQDAGLILGALRVDLEPEFSWTTERDDQLRRLSAAVSHALGRDLECLQLQGALDRQSDQLRTLFIRCAIPWPPCAPMPSC